MRMGFHIKETIDVDITITGKGIIGGCHMMPQVIIHDHITGRICNMVCGARAPFHTTVCDSKLKVFASVKRENRS